MELSLSCLVVVTPTSGDLVIVKRGNFILAITMDFDGNIKVYDSKAKYSASTGKSFQDFLNSKEEGRAENYIFYRMPSARRINVKSDWRK